MISLFSKKAIVTLFVFSLLIVGCNEKIITLGDSWTGSLFGYASELNKLMPDKDVVKSDKCWDPHMPTSKVMENDFEFLRTCIDENVGDKDEVRSMLVMLGAGDVRDKWYEYCGPYTPQNDSFSIDYICVNQPDCDLPETTDPIIDEWVIEIVDNLETIGKEIQDEWGYLPIFGIYSQFSDRLECGVDPRNTFTEIERSRLIAITKKLGNEMESRTYNNGWGFVNFWSLFFGDTAESNCCCFVDCVHPTRYKLTQPNLVSGNQMVAEKWCEEYARIFEPESNRNCVFSGERRCTDLSAPECE